MTLTRVPKTFSEMEVVITTIDLNFSKGAIALIILSMRSVVRPFVFIVASLIGPKEVLEEVVH